MQVALIGDDDSPQKQIIAKVLDSGRSVNRVALDPLAKNFNIRQRLVHCFIYVERSPNQIIIDKLAQANCPLVLIADTEHLSSLFIPFDDFFSPEYLKTFWENILGLRSLYDMEYQRNLFPLILGDEDNKEWERLIAERSHDSGWSTAHKLTARLDDLQNVAKFNQSKGVEKKNQVSNGKLSEIQQQVLNQIESGSSVAEILVALNISRRTYFRIISKAKNALGASSSLQLGLKSFK